MTFKQTIRWIAVLPAAFVAANLGYIAVKLVFWLIYNNTGDWLSLASAKTLDVHINAFVVPFVLILIGALVAPSHKLATGIILAIVCWTFIVVVVTLVISEGIIPLPFLPLIAIAGTLCGLFQAHKADKNAFESSASVAVPDPIFVRSMREPITVIAMDNSGPKTYPPLTTEELAK